jgi:hypothetical protein
MKSKIKFFRLSIANTSARKVDLLSIADKLAGFTELTDLELFLGGNEVLNNSIASEFIELLKDKPNLRNFEFDVGYSSVDDEIVSQFGRQLGVIEKLGRFGVYLNGYSYFI